MIGASVLGGAVVARISTHGSRTELVATSITFTLNKHGHFLPVTHKSPVAGFRAIPLTTSCPVVQSVGSPSFGAYVYMDDASIISVTSPSEGLIEMIWSEYLGGGRSREGIEQNG